MDIEKMASMEYGDAAEEMAAAALPEMEPEEEGYRLTDIIDLSFLKAKTGPGAVEDYIEHPFNPKKSRGMARIIRGFTGMLGEFDYAVIDIGLGTIEYIKENQNNEVTDGE